MQIVSLRACARTVGTTAGVDCDGLFAGDQTLVALSGAETESQAGLNDHVDEMLQDVRNTEVPHWQGKQVPICRLETVDHFSDPLPNLRLFRRMGLAVENSVFCVDSVTVETWQLGRPKVQLVDLDR